MLPSGEKRLGAENIGVALGYSKRFFFQRTKRQSKTLKTLQNMGFSGEQIWVNIIRQGQDRRGSMLAKTVSLRVFLFASYKQGTQILIHSNRGLSCRCAVSYIQKIGMRSHFR